MGRNEKGISHLLSIPMYRSGTPGNPDPDTLTPISIHPPLAGWDSPSGNSPEDCRYFNPPTPCGVGLHLRCSLRFGFHFNPPTPCGVGRLHGQRISYRTIFQSTHPLRGGTQQFLCNGKAAGISIHPPLAGWDLRHMVMLRILLRFQSTHPLRGGTTSA